MFEFLKKVEPKRNAVIIDFHKENDGSFTKIITIEIKDEDMEKLLDATARQLMY